MTKTGHAQNGDDTFIDCVDFSPTGEWIASKTYEKLDAWEMPSGEKLISTEIRSFSKITEGEIRMIDMLGNISMREFKIRDKIAETSQEQ